MKALARKNRIVRTPSSEYVPSTERKRSEIPYLCLKDKKGNLINEVVKVVPNRALKVKDIIDRYTRGLPIEEMSGSKPVWSKEDMTHDSPDLSKLSQLDKMDKKDLARGARYKIPKLPDQSPDAIANPDPPKS